jgi:hypothetical protein
MKRLTEQQVEQLCGQTAEFNARGKQVGTDITDVILRVAQQLEVPDRVDLRIMDRPSARLFFGDKEIEIFARTWRPRLVKPGEDPAGVILGEMQAQIRFETSESPEETPYLFAPYCAATEWEWWEGDERRCFAYRVGSRLMLPD